MLEENGTPSLGVDGIACTITVLPWSQRATLPAFSRMTFAGHENALWRPHQQLTEVARDEVAIALPHVADWTGFHVEGVPIPCSRAAVRAALASSRHLYRQVMAKIDEATVSHRSGSGEA